MIPGDDVESNGRLTLKIWPPNKIPETLVLDVHGRPVLNEVGSSYNAAVALDGTLRSSFEESLNKALRSLSSGTSVGKEARCENTIEQILGNIERSQIGERRDESQSYELSQQFRRQIEARLFGGRE